MKRLIPHIIVAVCIISHSGIMTAQRIENKRFFGFYADAMYSQMPHKDLPLTLTPTQGFSESMGGVFELQHELYKGIHKSNLLLHFGLGIRYSMLNTYLSAHNYDNDQLTDTQQRNFIMHYDFWRGRCDKIRAVNAELPILAGYNYNTFYFLAGCKLSARLSAITAVDSRVTATATYERYFEDYHDMPNHALYTADIQDHHVDFGRAFNVHALAEIGWVLHDSYDYRITGYAQRQQRNSQAIVRLALYADYGILNNANNTRYNLNDPNPNLPFNLDAIRMHHILETTAANGLYVPEFNVGVKFTILFRIQTEVKPTRGTRRHVDHQVRERKCKNCDEKNNKEKFDLDCIDCKEGEGWKQ